ncbi:MAG: response regulator [Bryobacteraceae bacterium]|jgi:CheY-like chemotaxis protein
MSRILLADDSPHAQRMGERILREEGFEVVTVTDGETAIIRLGDVDPDLVMADVFLPHKSGYEVCQHIKSHPAHRHTRVVLLAGLLEPVDEAEAERVQADGILKKPFEASVVVSTIRPLLEAAEEARRAAIEEQQAVPPEPDPELQPPPQPEPAPAPATASPAQSPPEIDSGRVRAAVTVALDRAMPALIDEITERVLVALGD